MKDLTIIVDWGKDRFSVVDMEWNTSTPRFEAINKKLTNAYGSSWLGYAILIG